MRGRRPAGPDYVEHLDGDEQSKKRLKVILQTMSGGLGVQEACRMLKVGPQRFHQLRETAMQAALEGLAPRPAGRPPRPVTPEQERLAQLEKKLLQADVDLRAAQAREEIAVLLPRVVHEPPAEEKKTRRRPRPAHRGK